MPSKFNYKNVVAESALIQASEEKIIEGLNAPMPEPTATPAATPDTAQQSTAQAVAPQTAPQTAAQQPVAPTAQQQPAQQHTPQNTPQAALQAQMAAPVGVSAPRTANNTLGARNADTEPLKGVQAWLPMSLYTRVMIQKMQQGKSLKVILEEAVRMWVSVQENR